MKRLIILAAAAAMTATAAYAQKPRITVGPDERTELMSVIMHLSGAEHYNHDVIIPQYRVLVDTTFAPYRRHPAVVQAGELFDEFGFAYAQPMEMALHGRIDGQGKFHSPFLPLYYFNERRHAKFIDAIGDFYRDTNFHDFYVRMAVPCYAHIGGRLEAAYNAKVDVGWLAEFTGVEEAGRSYGVVLSYLNGDFNYGLSPLPVMAINEGIDIDDIRYPMILLHEYLHPYINPITDRHYAELAPSGKVLFPPIREQMERSGYPEWKLVNYEALIRAAVIVYERERGLRTRIETTKNSRRGFWWTEQLADLLGEYQKQRDKYPTLESFMPEVVKFYDALASSVSREAM
jgi:hypothetical protein